MRLTGIFATDENGKVINYVAIPYTEENKREIVQKLGKYEDIDESPEHLSKVKQAFDIIKENLNIEEILLTVKGSCKASDYDLVKEVLL